jgi:hypothetical protein
VGHTSRFSGLLCMKASRVRISQFASRLADVRQYVVHVAPSRDSIVEVASSSNRKRQVDATGCVESCYPCFAVFILLVPRSIIVF